MAYNFGKRKASILLILALAFMAATCPPKPPAPKVWVNVCNAFPDMPAAEARLANDYCPAVHPAQYVQGMEPKTLCSIHVKPGPPIPQCDIPWPETRKLLIWSGLLLCDLSTKDNLEFQESDLDDYYNALAEDGVNATRSFAFFLDEQPGFWESFKPADAEYAAHFTARLKLITERKLTAIVSLWACGGGSTDSEIDYVIDLTRPFLPYVIFEPINEAYGMSGQIKIVNMLKAKGVPNSAIMVSFQDSGEFADMLVNGLEGKGLASLHGVGSMETIMAPWPRGWAESPGTLALCKLGLFGSSDGEDAEHKATGSFWHWLPTGPGRRPSPEQAYDITRWMLRYSKGWEFLSAAGFLESDRPNLKKAIENGKIEREKMHQAYLDSMK